MILFLRHSLTMHACCISEDARIHLVQLHLFLTEYEDSIDTRRCLKLT